MATDLHPPRRTTLVLGVLALVVVLAMGWWTGDLRADRARAESDASTIERLQDATVASSSRVLLASRAITAIAVRTAALGDPAALGGALVNEGREPFHDVEWIPAPPSSRPDLAVMLQRSIDAGGVAMTGPVEGELIVVRPIYRGPDGALTVDRGPGAGRRGRIAGWIAGVTTVPIAEAGVAVQTSAGVFGDLDGAAVAADEEIRVPGDVWSVSVARVPVDGGRSVTDLVAALVLIGVAVGLHVTAQRRRHRVGAALAVARRRGETVERVAAVVGRSLDPGEVLPGVVVDVCDQLGARGAVCTVTDERGRAIDAFTYGSLDGEVREFPMHLASRHLGSLRICTQSAMDDESTELMEVVAELLGGALLNARAFADQQEALRRQRQLTEATTTFLSTASHELRTPVAAIGGFAGGLLTGWESIPDGDKVTILGRINANAESMNRVVADLLDFARLEQGRMRVELEVVDLSVETASVVERIAVVFGADRIETDIDDGVVARVDRNGIERLITNLVSNANQYAPADAPIVVRVHAADNEVHLIVDDGGPGVPPAERELIFGRFFRGAGQEVVRTRGAGIGLSVVSEFVKRMNATISVRESPFGGARFIVAFPSIDPSEAT